MGLFFASGWACASTCLLLVIVKLHGISPRAACCAVGAAQEEEAAAATASKVAVHHDGLGADEATSEERVV